MRLFSHIAALLLLVLMTPLARASVVVTHGAKSQQYGATAHQDCCMHSADPCCEASSHLCCAVQVPIDTTPYPVQSSTPVVLPSAAIAVVYRDRVDIKARCVAVGSPEQSSPPGLVIAATIVLRI